MVVDDVNALIATSRPPLLSSGQIADAAESIPSNIREAYGRRAGPERIGFFRYARGSAEETDERLRSNFAANRIKPVRYWRLHNRLMVIIRMLTKLIGD